MTLGEAIRDAHARGDAAERNRLMAWANDGASLRELQELLGCALASAHRWTAAGRAENPRSRMESTAPSSTIVPTQIAPAPLSRPGAWHRTSGGPEHG